LVLFFIPLTAYEQGLPDPNFGVYLPQESPLLNKGEILVLIVEASQKWHVSRETMTDIVRCESGFDQNIQSRHLRPDGSREQSFGLVQIHLPDHPEVTKGQALDPAFSIEFLARELSLGNGWMWTCFKIISG